jgi:hypothetical protein
MSIKAPKPKGRKASGELDETVVVESNVVETTKVESTTLDAQSFPINFFGKVVKDQLELEEVKKSFDESIKDKMIKGIELTEYETGYKLSLEPKVSIFIPRVKGDPAGAAETATVNGYKYVIKKGVRVLLPRTVGKIIDNHLMSEDLLIDESIENNEDKKSALQ